VTKVDDPYDCTTNPTTGLTSPTSGIVSLYRRPLPSTNVDFLSAIMWDGREPTLESQAALATDGTAIKREGKTYRLTLGEFVAHERAGNPPFL
jgi:hypothetical protein